MFARLRKHRTGRTAGKPTRVRAEAEPVNFGLFGVYVRSLPSMGR